MQVAVPRKTEEIVHQPAQAPHFHGNKLEELVRLLPAVILLSQYLRGIFDNAERVANLMRDRGSHLPHRSQALRAAQVLLRAQEQRNRAGQKISENNQYRETGN